MKPRLLLTATLGISMLIGCSRPSYIPGSLSVQTSPLSTAESLPPSPATENPLPSRSTETPTPAPAQSPTPEADRNIEGWGQFPRLVVAATAADGITMALYLVESNTATQILSLEGTLVGKNQIDVHLSPDEQHVACLRTEGNDLHSLLEVIDVQTAQRVVIAESPQGAHGKGAAAEELTSLAWMDTGHILYSKVRWPSSKEWETSGETGTPLSVPGEVWLSDAEGKEQRLLVTGPVYRVLGASPEGQIVYVTRLISGREAEREEGFALLDLESNEIRNLWPQEERGTQRYHTFKLITLPDGTWRLLFATGQRVDTAVDEPPVIWMADPEGGYAEAIWMIEQGRESSKGEMTWTNYDVPHDFLWSPHSEHEFVYSAHNFTSGIWGVDLAVGQSTELVPGPAPGRSHLIAWASEGLVAQSFNRDQLHLWSETGEMTGEIIFSE